MNASSLAPDVEQALAALAASDALDLDALQALERLMDAIGGDARVDAERCAALARGLDEVFGPEAARALTDDAEAPAEIAARFFRLQQLALVTSALSARQR